MSSGEGFLSLGAHSLLAGSIPAHRFGVEFVEMVCNKGAALASLVHGGSIPPNTVGFLAACSNAHRCREEQAGAHPRMSRCQEAVGLGGGSPPLPSPHLTNTREVVD